MKQKNGTIEFIGSPGVGKTTIVISLVENHFTDEVLTRNDFKTWKNEYNYIKLICFKNIKFITLIYLWTFIVFKFKIFKRLKYIKSFLILPINTLLINEFHASYNSRFIILDEGPIHKLLTMIPDYCNYDNDVITKIIKHIVNVNNHRYVYIKCEDKEVVNRLKHRKVNNSSYDNCDPDLIYNKNRFYNNIINRYKYQNADIDIISIIENKYKNSAKEIFLRLSQ